MKVKYKKWFLYVPSANDQEELKNVYISMFKIFEKMETANITLMYSLVNKLEQTEFKMQELFGFKQDRNYHRYWLHSPGCTCPKLDNQDNYGTKYRIIDLDCPVHGEKIKNIEKRKDKIKRLINDK